MKLPVSITFDAASLEEAVIQPTEDGGKLILAIATPFLPDSARALEILEFFYAENGLSREFTGAVGLPCEQGDMAVSIRQDSGNFGLLPEKIRAFKVSHENNAVADWLVLRFRVHLVSPHDVQAALGWALDINKDTFAIELSARQGELPLAEEVETASAA
jgi:hypothetical protein